VVLAVNLSKPDRHILAALSNTMSWRLIRAGRLTQALRKTKSCPVGVILCERDLPDGNWKRLFDAVRDMAHAPRFIVTSRLADDRLWAEVLNLGGYDVLATPFIADEVCRVVSSALDSHHWHGQAVQKAGSLSNKGSG
jgi:DNA-binding response OmpR family regulator